MEAPKAGGQSFNISTATGHTVLELAKVIWYRMRDDEFNYVSDPPFEYDVKKRIPDVTKAKEVLGFEATTTLEYVLDAEIIPWIKEYARELEKAGK
jgi:nucleoside-diphosphate-sugar epimerase